MILIALFAEQINIAIHSKSEPLLCFLEYAILLFCIFFFCFVF